MESLGIDRYFNDYMTAYVPMDISPTQAPVGNPFFSSYDMMGMDCYVPVFNQDISVFSSVSNNPFGYIAPPTYAVNETVGNLFDSNSYVGDFATSGIFGGYAESAAVMPIFMDFFQMPFQLPMLNLADFKLPQFTLPQTMRKSVTQQTAKSSSLGSAFNTTVKYDSIKNAGYNPTLGKMLAQDIAANAEPKSTGYCAKYVSNTLARLGIAGKRGDAWQLADSLRRNPNFREIDASSVNPKNLPAGCVIVYPQGSAGYSKKYGHVEIALGNGKAASDFINKNIQISPDMQIFVPVSA